MQCKPGDLAIVVNDLEYPVNNGCLLEILGRATPGAHAIPADWVGRPSPPSSLATAPALPTRETPSSIVISNCGHCETVTAPTKRLHGLSCLRRWTT